MVLSGEFMSTVRADIIKVLQFLHKQDRNYGLSAPTSIATTIYHYYATHGKETIREVVPLIHHKLTQTITGINAIGIFNEQADSKQWKRYYSWKLEEDLNDEIIDSCSIRIYLNPKLEYIDKVLIDLITFYHKLPVKSPLMFKILDPNHIQNNLIFLKGADKAVLYVNPANELVERLQARLLSYPEDYFYNSIPLFSKKVRNGVGIAYEPKERSLLIQVLQGLNVLAKNEVALSYGQFMSYAIAQGIRMEIMRLKIRRHTETINFSTLSEEQMKSITIRTIVFVFDRMKEDLHLE